MLCLRCASGEEHCGLQLTAMVARLCQLVSK